MAERKATNKYYPPDYDPRKGGLNKQRGSHALGSRAKKLDQGILVIRFELPFGIWCGGCGRHLAMGVRFNAEKKRVGAYYTTAIWSFRMKCPSCPQHFEIRTDPKNSEYVVMEGARRKVDMSTEEDVQITHTQKEKERRAGNPLAQLEFSEEERRKRKEAEERIEALQALSDKQWDRPFELNQKARSIFRVGRKEREAEASKVKTIKDKLSLSVTLLPESQEDGLASRQVDFQGADLSLEEQRRQAASRPLFSARKPSSSAPSGPSRGSGRLRDRLLTTTRLRRDPFSAALSQPPSQTNSLSLPLKTHPMSLRKGVHPSPPTVSIVSGDYEGDSDDE